MASQSGTLATLRLSANAIGEMGALALAGHLRGSSHSELRAIALSNNPIGPKGGEALRGALRTCSSVTELSLTGVGLTKEQADEIEACVARNRTAAKQESRKQTKSLIRAASLQAAECTDTAGHLQRRGGSSGGGEKTAARPTPASATAARSGQHSSHETPSQPGKPAAAHSPSCGRSDGRPVVAVDLASMVAPLPGLAAAAAPAETDRFAPTGDLTSGIVRQRRELFMLPSARLVLLDGVGLADEHADEIAEYLRDNSRTELLHLGGNEFTDDGIMAISGALATCAVRRLSIAGNNVQDDGARAIGRALADGFHPMQLDLSDNMITDEGAIELIELAVSHGNELVWLDLRLNPLMTAEGCQEAVGVAAKGRFTLQL